MTLELYEKEFGMCIENDDMNLSLKFVTNVNDLTF